MTTEPGLVHCVAFTWKPGTPAAAVTAVADGLSALQQHLGLRDYRFGADLAATDGNADFGLVAWFPSTDAWRQYMSHPEHQRLIAERVAPILAAKASFQIPGGSVTARSAS